LSAPKLTAQTALLEAEELYIKHPLAVKEAELILVSANLQHAVSPDKTGVVLVRAFPPVVYPVPLELTS
jgi:hypothetical protein